MKTTTYAAKGSGLLNTEIDANFLLNSPGIFNITAYGASPSASAATNSTAINAAIADATAYGRGGVVFIPPGGDFLHNGNIPFSGKVAFKGVGRNHSCLKSATAAPCFASQTGTTYDFAATISGLRLEGNNVGTIGIYSVGQAHYLFDDLFIGNFTQKGIELHGSLIMECRYVCVENCLVGCDGVFVVNGQPNLVRFNYCTWRLNKKWAVRFDTCASVQFDFNEWGGNGTQNDLTSGCVQLTNMSPLKEGVGGIFNGGWFEGNFGIFADFQEPINDTTHVFNGFISQLGDPVHTGGGGIRVTGSGHKNVVNLFGCSIVEQAGQYDVQAVGAKARVINWGGLVGVVATASGGTYIDRTDSTTAPVTGGLRSDAQSRYLAAVAAKNPTYSNSLSSSQNPLPAETGTALFTLDGAVSVRQPGPFSSADATSYAVGIQSSGVGKLPFDLSPYNAAAISILINTPGYTHTGGAVYEYGFPRWDHATGDFTYAPFSNQGGPSDYKGTLGVRQPNGTGSQQFVQNLPSGWVELVLVISRGRFTKYLINGVEGTPQDDANNPTTDLAFPNDVLQVLLADVAGFAAHLNIWVASSLAGLPSTADFQAIHNSVYQ